MLRSMKEELPLISETLELKSTGISLGHTLERPAVFPPGGGMGGELGRGSLEGTSGLCVGTSARSLAMDTISEGTPQPEKTTCCVTPTLPHSVKGKTHFKSVAARSQRGGRARRRSSDIKIVNLHSR